MRWEIISSSQLEQASQDWLLQQSTILPAVAVELGSDLHPVILPTEQQEQTPVIIYTMAEFEHFQTWQYILKLYTLPKIELARYNAKHPELKSEIFLQALGSKINFRTLEHWRELAQLDDNTYELAIQYDYNISIMRLWNRFPMEDRKTWQFIWQKRNIRKNLIREMIEDYYDLSKAKQKEILKAAVEFETGWGNSDAVFPSEKLRDMIRQARFPEMIRVRQDVENVRRKLKLPRNVRLSIPNDLELHELELSFKFHSSVEYEQIIENLTGENIKLHLDELIQLL